MPLVGQISVLEHVGHRPERVAPRVHLGLARAVAELVEEPIGKQIGQPRLHRIGDELLAGALVEVHASPRGPLREVTRRHLIASVRSSPVHDLGKVGRRVREADVTVAPTALNEKARESSWLGGFSLIRLSCELVRGQAAFRSLAFALVFPAEEVLLPDVREPVAAGGLGDGLSNA